jgi:preprotein translocase subunit SecY
MIKTFLKNLLGFTAALVGIIAIGAGVVFLLEFAPLWVSGTVLVLFVGTVLAILKTVTDIEERAKK